MNQHRVASLNFASFKQESFSILKSLLVMAEIL